MKKILFILLLISGFAKGQQTVWTTGIPTGTISPTGGSLSPTYRAIFGVDSLTMNLFFGINSTHFYQVYTAAQANAKFYNANNLSFGSGLSFTSGVLSATATAPTWGSITGSISSQTDLQTALNAKQSIGNYITALTGDGTATGPGSSALTLGTVNSNVGSFGDATHSGTFTVNGKGLITSASNTAITFPVTLSNSVSLTNKDLTGSGNTFPTFNQNTSGTAANITATSNSTLTTLSALALPYSQITGTPSLTGYVPYTGATGNVTLGTNSLTAGLIDVGTLTYTATNPLAIFQSSVNGFNQFIIQNSNSGSAASSDVVVNNNNSTNTTFYGDFGMNSSGFTGTGAFNQPNNVYLTSTSSDLAIGTTTSNAIHFVVNNGTTDAMTIASTGTISLLGLSTGLLHSSSVGLLTSSLVGITDLSATGTPSSTTYLRGDNTWATVSGGISGLTTNYVTKAASSTTLTNSLIYDDGVGVMLGITTNSGFALEEMGSTRTQGDIKQGILLSPVLSSATGSTTGGSIPAGTYYYKIVAVDVGTVAQTLGSNERTVTLTGTTSSVSLVWTNPNSFGVRYWRIYRGTSPSSESLYYQTASSQVLSFTDINGTSTSAAIPTTNTTALNFINQNGINNMPIWNGTGSVGTNLFINGGANTTTAGLVTAISGPAGSQAGQAITTATQTSLFGSGAGNKMTTASNASAFGANSMANTLTTNGGTHFGNSSGQNDKGSENTGIGNFESAFQTTGSNNFTAGSSAGTYYGGGTSNAATIFNNSIFIGQGSSPLADNQTNQIVIARNGLGNGSNTTTIGNSSTTKTYLFGQLSTGETQTSVNASTSGTILYSEPFFGTFYKKVIIYCNSTLGTASGTFPVAFTNTPVVLTTSGLASSLVTTLTTTGFTITGTTNTGFLIIEGY